MSDELLTIEEAAARLGCSAATVRRRIADGHLEVHHRWGRTLVSAAAVESVAVDDDEADELNDEDESDDEE